MDSVQAQELRRFELETRQMGVRFGLIVYADDLEKARTAMIAAVNRIQSIENRLSDYLDDSEISILTSTAKAKVPVQVSADLINVLALSKPIWKQTDGLFDPTVGPLTRIWRTSRATKKLPTPDLIMSARKQVGFKNVKLNAADSTVTFSQPRTSFDFGGIAKGYAADQALAILKKNGIDRALIDAGGDITVGCPPPGKKGWKIAISKSDSGQNLLLKNASVATSGDRFQFLEIDGKKYSHIIDPTTGYGALQQNMVTVVAFGTENSGALADGYASAFSLMPVEKIKTLVGKLPRIESRIQSESKKKGTLKLVFQSGYFSELDQ